MLEQLIRNSDNLIKLTLKEDGVAISGAWDELDVWIGGVQIHRIVDGDGITLSDSTGLFTLSPGDLTAPEKAALDLLPTGRYRAQIIVTSALNDDGAVFGGEGSGGIFFQISDKPV